MWSNKFCSGQQSNLTHIHHVTFYSPNNWRPWIYTTILSIDGQFVCLYNATMQLLMYHRLDGNPYCKDAQSTRDDIKRCFCGFGCSYLQGKNFKHWFWRKKSYKDNYFSLWWVSHKSDHIDTHVDIATMFVF